MTMCSLRFKPSMSSSRAAWSSWVARRSMMPGSTTNPAAGYADARWPVVCTNGKLGGGRVGGAGLVRDIVLSWGRARQGEVDDEAAPGAAVLEEGPGLRLSLGDGELRSKPDRRDRGGRA